MSLGHQQLMRKSQEGRLRWEMNGKSKMLKRMSNFSECVFNRTWRIGQSDSPSGHTGNMFSITLTWFIYLPGTFLFQLALPWTVICLQRLIPRDIRWTTSHTIQFLGLSCGINSLLDLTCYLQSPSFHSFKHILELPTGMLLCMLWITSRILSTMDWPIPVMLNWHCLHMLIPIMDSVYRSGLVSVMLKCNRGVGEGGIHLVFQCKEGVVVVEITSKCKRASKGDGGRFDQCLLLMTIKINKY